MVELFSSESSLLEVGATERAWRADLRGCGVAGGWEALRELGIWGCLSKNQELISVEFNYRRCVKGLGVRWFAG